MPCLFESWKSKLWRPFFCERYISRMSSFSSFGRWQSRTNRLPETKTDKYLMQHWPWFLSFVYRFFFNLVGGDVRVIRSCGYIKSSNEDPETHSCFKSAFTSYSSSLYCDCNEDECNSAFKLSHSFILTIVAAALKVLSLL